MTGVDVEGGRLEDRPVLAVEHRVDLGERHALDGDRDFDEVAGLGLEVRQPVEAADLPARAGVGQAQLGHGVGPGEVAEVALLLEVFGDVDLIETCEVVVHHLLLEMKSPARWRGSVGRQVKRDQAASASRTGRLQARQEVVRGLLRLGWRRRRSPACRCAAPRARTRGSSRAAARRRSGSGRTGTPRPSRRSAPPPRRRRRRSAGQVCRWHRRSWPVQCVSSCSATL